MDQSVKVVYLSVLCQNVRRACMCLVDTISWHVFSITSADHCISTLLSFQAVHAIVTEMLWLIPG